MSSPDTLWIAVEDGDGSPLSKARIKVEADAVVFDKSSGLFYVTGLKSEQVKVVVACRRKKSQSRSFNSKRHGITNQLRSKLKPVRFVLGRKKEVLVPVGEEVLPCRIDSEFLYVRLKRGRYYSDFKEDLQELIHSHDAEMAEAIEDPSLSARPNPDMVKVRLNKPGDARNACALLAALREYIHVGTAGYAAIDPQGNTIIGGRNLILFATDPEKVVRYAGSMGIQLAMGQDSPKLILSASPDAGLKLFERMLELYNMAETKGAMFDQHQ